MDEPATGRRVFLLHTVPERCLCYLVVHAWYMLYSLFVAAASLWESANEAQVQGRNNRDVEHRLPDWGSRCIPTPQSLAVGLLGRQPTVSSDLPCLAVQQMLPGKPSTTGRALEWRKGKVEDMVLAAILAREYRKSNTRHRKITFYDVFSHHFPSKYT